MGRGLQKITYERLNEIAYQQIVDAMRTGDLEPGRSLQTRMLAKQLGISSTPIREALSKLIAQNALDVKPSSGGAVVPQLTRELLTEMYQIRGLLDAMAVRAAAEHISADQAAQLTTLARELDSLEAAGRTNDTEYLDKSEQFFLGVFAAAQRPILYSLLENLWLRSSVITGLLSRRPPAGFTISAHRRDLAAALQQHDPDAAEAAVSAVLDTTSSMVLDLLDDAAGDAHQIRSDQPGPGSA